MVRRFYWVILTVMGPGGRSGFVDEWIDGGGAGGHRSAFPVVSMVGFTRIGGGFI